MARGWVKAAALYTGAVVLGVASAWLVLTRVGWSLNSFQVGAWRGTTLAGSAHADMYTRAVIALKALLALDRSETLYYVAERDDAGKPLRSRCNYRVTGKPPDARWWSVTANADDLYLFDAPNRQFSLNGDTAVLGSDGSFDLTTGPQPIVGTHWLPTPSERGVVLALRLYNPSPAVQANPAGIVPPSIQPLGPCP